MTITTILDTLPTAPSRKRPNDFSEEMDDFLYAIVPFQSDVNDIITEINATTLAVSDNAAAAALSEENALTYQQLTLASANFKGQWANLTGALAIPATVEHDSKLWLLLSSLADVTAKEPGVDAEWLVLNLPQTGDVFMSAVSESTMLDRGLLPCDGAAYLKTAYPALYAVVGTLIDQTDRLPTPLLVGAHSLACKDAERVYLAKTVNKGIYGVSAYDIASNEIVPDFCALLLTGYDVVSLSVDDDYIYAGVGETTSVIYDKETLQGYRFITTHLSGAKYASDSTHIASFWVGTKYIVKKGTWESVTVTLGNLSTITGCYSSANHFYWTGVASPFIRLTQKSDFTEAAGTPILAASPTKTLQDDNNLYFLSTKLEKINTATLALTTGPTITAGFTDAILTDDFIVIAYDGNPHVKIYNKSDLAINNDYDDLFSSDIGVVKLAQGDNRLFVGSELSPFLKIINLNTASIEDTDLADSAVDDWMIYDTGNNVLYHSKNIIPYMSALSIFGYNILTEFTVPKIEIPGTTAYIITGTNS